VFPDVYHLMIVRSILLLQSMNRYRNIFSVVLIIAMLWNVFYVSFTYVYYFVDQEGFIAEYCVNIAKPELKCNGKCHLKEVSEKDATNDKAPSKMMITKDVNLYVQEIKKICFGFIIYTKKQINNYYNLYSYLSEYTLYQPPQGLFT